MNSGAVNEVFELVHPMEELRVTDNENCVEIGNDDVDLERKTEGEEKEKDKQQSIRKTS